MLACLTVADGGRVTVSDSRLVGADGSSVPFPCDGMSDTCRGVHDGPVVVDGPVVIGLAAPLVCDAISGQCLGSGGSLCSAGFPAPKCGYKSENGQDVETTKDCSSHPAKCSYTGTLDGGFANCEGCATGDGVCLVDCTCIAFCDKSSSVVAAEDRGVAGLYARQCGDSGLWLEAYTSQYGACVDLSTCEADTCTSDAAGTCASYSYGGAYCTCNHGYEGPHCETLTDYCPTDIRTVSSPSTMCPAYKPPSMRRLSASVGPLVP